MIDHCERLQHVAALLGKPFRHVDEFPSPVRKQLPRIVFSPRQVPRQGIAHLDRRRKVRRTPDQHVLEVLARVLVSAEEQGDLLSSADLRDDARGEHAFAAWASGLSVADCDPQAGIRQGDVPLPAASPAISAESSTDPSSVESSTGSSTRSSVNACRSIIARILTVVSSLYNTSPWAAWRTSSSKTGSARSAWSATISHWVEAGKGMPRPSCSVSLRFKGIPVPYLSKAIMRCRRSRHFSSPAPGGKSGVETAPRKDCSGVFADNRPWRPRGLADQPHHHTRTLAVVNGSRFALRARIARLEARSEADFDLLGGRKHRPHCGRDPGATVLDLAPAGTAAKPWSSPLANRSRPRDGLPSVAEPRFRASSPAGASPPGNAARAASRIPSGGCCPTTIAVFSVFAPKRIFRSRAMVVFLLPTA